MATKNKKYFGKELESHKKRMYSYYEKIYPLIKKELSNGKSISRISFEHHISSRTINKVLKHFGV